jgi:multiple sugar transport system substrate-binding protein
MILSKQKVIFASIVVLIVILAGVLVFLLGRQPTASNQPVIPPATLEVWGVFDSSDVMTPLTRAFHDRYPNLTANYRMLTVEEYESAILNALAAGKGPDVYMINNTWVPRYMERLRPASPASFDVKTFQDSFVEVVYDDLVVGGKIYGVPLHMDTLGLFYNKDYLASAGIATPPATWEEFMQDVKLLTRKDAKGNVTRAGITMGTAKNVNRSFDVLALLMMQQGAQMIPADHSRATFDEPLSVGHESFYPAQRALTFYTDFANPRKQVYSWNTLQHFSTDAFIAGEAAMTINYSRIIPLIESRSPYMHWAVAPVPQISSRDIDVNFGNYWAFAVSATSKHPDQAWQFLKFATERDNAKKYADAAKRPVARKDLVDVQRNDVKLGVFAVQALTAHSWYEVDNNAIEELFTEMIESVVRGSDSVKDAVGKAAKQVGLLMRRY